MKTLLLLAIILIIFLNSIFGQHNHDFRAETRNPQLDELHSSFERIITPKEVDSLYSIRNTLPNGEKIIYWDSFRKKPHFRFEIRDGNISGPFYCYNINGILTTVGNYFNDSLWTFKHGYFLSHDTTFKVGSWRYYSLQNSFDSTYYSAFTMDRDYKVPFDDSIKFVQLWTFLNGQLWEKRIFEKNIGLIEHNIFNKDGTCYSDFERLKNCSIYRSWDSEENLEYMTITDKMTYYIKLRGGDERFIHYKLNDPENKMDQLLNPKGEDFQTRLFYPNGNLMEFYDRKAGIKIIYDDSGNVVKVEKRKGVKVKNME